MRRRDEIWQDLALAIDNFIRTRNKFDSRTPLSYFCGINAIEENVDIMKC